PPPPGENLTASVDALTNTMISLHQQVDALTKERDAANKKVQDTIAQLTEARGTFDKGVAESRGQADQAVAGATQDRASKDEQIKKLTGDAETAQKAAQEAQAQAQVTLTDLTKQLDEARKQVAFLQNRLGGKRMN